MKTDREYLPATTAAATALGAQVAAGRRAHGWTAHQFADRLGVSVPTLRRIERGEPSVAVGTVLEAAVLVGVELFGTDAETASLERVARNQLTQVALLPARIRTQKPVIDDDF